LIEVHVPVIPLFRYLEEEWGECYWSA
jgi:hypothetical protein